MTDSLAPVVAPGHLADLADHFESHRVVNDIAVLFLDRLPGHIADVSQSDRRGDSDASRAQLREIEANARMLGADRIAAAAHALDHRLADGHRMTPLDADRMLAIASQTDDMMRANLCNACATEDLSLIGTPETLRNRSGALGSATCPVPRDGEGCVGAV